MHKVERETEQCRDQQVDSNIQSVKHPKMPESEKCAVPHCAKLSNAQNWNIVRVPEEGVNECA